VENGVALTGTITLTAALSAYCPPCREDAIVVTLHGGPENGNSISFRPHDPF